jgi:hypothetical protein
MRRACRDPGRPMPHPELSDPRPRSRLDALPARELVARALASLGLGTGKAARLLRTDVRTLQRVRTGGRDVLPWQWRTLAAALDARALYERHARELAGACRRRAAPVDEFLEERA